MNMRFRNKKYIVIPAAIVIYTLVIAIYAGIKYYTPENKITYFLVIGVNLLLAVLLYFVLKRREDFRNNSKK